MTIKSPRVVKVKCSTPLIKAKNRIPVLKNRGRKSVLKRVRKSKNSLMNNVEKWKAIKVKV